MSKEKLPQVYEENKKDKKNHVHVFTEAEYLHITWWSRVKRKLLVVLVVVLRDE